MARMCLRFTDYPKIFTIIPNYYLGYDNSLWYEIHFKDGVAVSVRLQKGWHGG